MRKIIAGCVLAFACMAQAQTNVVSTNVVSWTSPVSITQVAITVRLDGINVSISPKTGKASITVQWACLDGSGKTIRTGVTTYTEDQITALLTGSGFSIEALRTLFLGMATAAAQQ